MKMRETKIDFVVKRSGHRYSFAEIMGICFWSTFAALVTVVLLSAVFKIIGV